MDRRWFLCLAVGAMLAFPALSKEAAPGKKAKKGGEGSVEHAPVMSLEAIQHKLGDTPLSEDQAAKVTALREEVLKQLSDLEAKEEVKAAKEELKQAKAGGDAEAAKTAAAKLKELMGGFNPGTAFKKGLEGILTPEQMAKLAGGGEKGAKGEKGEKAGKGEPKNENEQP